MPTLYSELTAFCQKNNKPIPNKNDRNILGHLIAQFFRQARGVKDVPKQPSHETILVATYPEDFRQNIQALIKQFFEMPSQELNKLRCAKPPEKKKFNFDIDNKDKKVFEAMLTKKGLSVFVAARYAKKTLYRIEYVNPGDLIYLGMAFMKNKTTAKV